MDLRGKFSFHRRHYAPLYGLAALLIVVTSTFPSLAPQQAGIGGAESAAFADTPAVSGTPGRPGSGTPSEAPLTLDGSPRASAPSAHREVPRPKLPGAGRTGITAGGFACEPGVRQLPWSDYTAKCLPAFDGSNGGSTYRGVTKDTIKFVVRRLPGDTAIGPLASAQGLGDPEAWAEARRVFTSYFNRTYELYGRKVVFEMYDGSGDTFAELNERGSEAACKDAKEIADSRKAFGVIFWGPAGTSGPFSACAAKQGLFVPFGAFYYPESSLAKWHPYVWSALPQADDIGRDGAEYIGKRLANRKAKWAGDEESTQQRFKTRTRSFGMFVPKNPSYRVLGDTLERDAESKWGFKIRSRYDYDADPATTGRDVNDAIAQFKSAGVTSIVLATEFLSMKLLTRRAAAQDYFPEWILVGMGWTDFETVARECDQRAVDGRLFGMSQFGGAKMYSRTGEAFRTWKRAAPGREAPEFMPFMYYFMVDLYNKLQLAGPNLTPANVAAGVRSFRGGSRYGAVGRWSYEQRHSASSDAREVYWDAQATGFDGRPGAYLETYRGRRFDRGEWKKESPPIYPSS